jgi:UDP-glucose 4-epimerase
VTKVLVTGATGFVGRHLCELLVQNGYDVTGTTRSEDTGFGPSAWRLMSIGDIGGEVEWAPLLRDVDYVVHLAARVHVMHEQEHDPLAAFRRVNVAGTDRLLRSAGEQGVKRVVFVSTIKVHGEGTQGVPYKSDDTLAPTDPYGQSKLEAEQVLERLGRELGIETSVIRPPLVYGSGVGGNFIRLMRLVARGIPLPFGRIDNARSLVYVGNLCDLVCECLANPRAAGEQFLVSDNADMSTKQLVQNIAAAMSKPSRLLPVPAALLRGAAKLIGRGEEVSRLTDSLQVDIADTIETLGWTPPVSPEEGIRTTVQWYERQQGNA